MPVKIYRRGDIWHYRGTVAGRRLRGSTGTSSKETAQRIAVEIETREWKSNLDGPEETLTFAKATLLYLSAEKPIRFVKKLADYWKDKPVKQITSGTVRQCALTLYPKAKGATRNRLVIVPTQAIINHAASLDLCRRLKVERFPVVTRAKEPATWQWVEKFMANAEPGLAALAAFMFLTGARITEAVSVTWADVDLQKRRARIMSTKIGAERRAHLPPVLVAAIANIESERKETDRVFGFESRDKAKFVWKAATKKAGIKYLTYHSCRHGFATAMLHQGIDPVTVAKLGGWKSAQHVFSTYGHAMSDDTLADRIIGTPVTQNSDVVPFDKRKQNLS